MPTSERRAAKVDRTASATGEVWQLKVWLMGVSPMIWRRLHVPPTMTLRELHGTLQVAMGWESLHLYQFVLRGVRYGSWELAARSPDVTLGDLKLRRRARFVYEYDGNVPWCHELRLEDRVERRPRRHYPLCVDGHEACPPEDIGGVEGYQVRRDAWMSWDSMEDLRDLLEIIRTIDEERPVSLSDDQADEMQDILDRMQMRENWKGIPFSKRTVNERLRADEHLVLMHQHC